MKILLYFSNIYTAYPYILWLAPPSHYGTLHSFLLTITCYYDRIDTTTSSSTSDPADVIYFRLLNIYQRLPTSAAHLLSSSTSSSICGPLHPALLRRLPSTTSSSSSSYAALNYQRTGLFDTSELGWRQHF